MTFPPGSCSARRRGDGAEERRPLLAGVAGLAALGPRMAVSVEQAKLEEEFSGRCSTEEPAGLESRCCGRSVSAVAGWGGGREEEEEWPRLGLRERRAWGLRYVFFRFKGLGY